MWLSSLIGVGSDLLNWGLNQYSGLSKSEQQQNAFNASEAEKARNFTAQQAEDERDWQEEMYAKYNSFSGKMSQAAEAGVNPMFAATGSSVTPMSPSAGIGSSPAASGSSSRGPSPDMVGSILGFSKLKAEIDNIQAQTRSFNSQSLLNEIDSITRGELNEVTIGQAMQAIRTSKADESFKVAQTGEVASRVLNTDADTKVKVAQLGEIGSRIALNKANENLAVAQLGEVASRIANTDQDTRLKASQIAYVAMQARSEKAMVGLITQNTHLSRQQRKESASRVRLLVQSADHAEIMNLFSEAAAGRRDVLDSIMTPQTKSAAAAKWLLESLVEVLSLGGYTSWSNSTSTSTTTVVDGNDYPTRGKIGF